MDSVKQSIDKAQHSVDAGLEQAASKAKTGLAQASASAAELWKSGEDWLDVAKGHGDSALQQAVALQDQAFDVLKDGIEYCILHPYISYPAAGAALLVALPGVRRFTYRMTLGRLRNPEAMVSSAETKLSTIGAKTDEFGAESKKLQERAQLAYEEWTRGRQKLKAARQELQRLELSVGRSERLTRAVLDDLRSLRQSRAVELRSEAASKLSLLKQQRAALQKEIKWIVKEDV